MATEYNSNIHTHVMFNKDCPKEGSFNGPCVIEHHVGDRVWVAACYADFPVHDSAFDCVMVGDGLTTGYSEHGNCIVSINVKHVLGYYTPEEADGIEQCMDADERLLGYAR